MRRYAAMAALAMLALVACAAAPPVAPPVVKEAVAEEPCKVNLPPRPTFPADTLTGDEDIWTIGVTLWSDYLARRAWEQQLEAALQECSRPDGGPQ